VRSPFTASAKVKKSDFCIFSNTYACMCQYEEAVNCQQTSVEIAREIGDR